MGYRSYLSSYETVLIKNKSVDLQRDIISTLTPAVFMSCLDFVFPIPAETSIDSKILLFAKFRSFTRNPWKIPINSLEFRSVKIPSYSVHTVKAQLWKHFFEFVKEQYDFGIINAALRNASTNRETATHFICATRYYSDDHDPPIDLNSTFKHKFLEGMKKYRIKTAVLTKVEIFRDSLVTKETMIDYHKGKYKKEGCNEHSLNDDLEILFGKMKLEQVNNEEVQTFCFPKLTNKEMKLVESKDVNHLESYAATPADVKEAEMKLSDSKSKFVDVSCSRKTIVFKNRPINGYFKRSIENREQSEDEPKSKFRRRKCFYCGRTNKLSYFLKSRSPFKSEQLINNEYWSHEVVALTQTSSVKWTNLSIFDSLPANFRRRKWTYFSLTKKAFYSLKSWKASKHFPITLKKAKKTSNRNISVFILVNWQIQILG